MKENIFFSEENEIGKEKRGIELETESMFFLQIKSRGKGGKYLEKENMYFAEEKNNGGGKGGTFAKGWSIRIIICKRLVDPDIICKRTVDLNDHLQGAGPSEVSLANGRSTRMIICNHKYIV